MIFILFNRQGIGRIKGEYEITLIDAVEGTHYDDLIMVASSDYDPHFVGYGV